MKPKTRSELRASIIDPLYKFLKNHDDLLEFESVQINEALKLLVIADIHLFHLGVCHTEASRAGDVHKVEKIDVRPVEFPCDSSDLPF